MRRKLFYMAGIIAVVILLQSFELNNESITFQQTSWGDIGRKAKAEKKMIFVIVKAEWCGACKKMNKITANGSVGKFYNEKFISTAFDADNLLQYYRASNWGITTVPALVFLDERRNLIHKAEGGRSAAGMLEEAKIAMEKRKNIWERKLRRNKVQPADSTALEK